MSPDMFESECEAAVRVDRLALIEAIRHDMAMPLSTKLTLLRFLRRHWRRNRRALELAVDETLRARRYMARAPRLRDGLSSLQLCSRFWL
jgi:hypothetical protein